MHYGMSKFSTSRSMCFHVVKLHSQPGRAYLTYDLYTPYVHTSRLRSRPWAVGCFSVPVSLQLSAKNTHLMHVYMQSSVPMYYSSIRLSAFGRCLPGCTTVCRYVGYVDSCFFRPEIIPWLTNMYLLCNIGIQAIVSTTD